MERLRIPSDALVVLVGPSGSGKSTWAQEQFREDQVVSSDRLRVLVGTGEHDQRAGKDAFDVLWLVVERRLRRRLLTVVDTLGLDGPRRRRLLRAAREAGVPCVAVVFDVAEDLARARNRARARRVPAAAIAAQLRSFTHVRGAVHDEGFDLVSAPRDVRIVAPLFTTAPAALARQQEAPVTLEFGLQIPRFAVPGGAASLGPLLREIAQAAEEVGFTTLWLMDHLVQIPQVGREWEDLPESWTTLGYLAAATSSIRLGTLVTAVTFRSVPHLAKIVATLDVLSGGRALCGLGAAWSQREHELYAIPFPALAQRYALLEDALRLLPLMWGPGAPEFEGRTLSVPEAVCYPRPLQERIPILVGGSGERRTLRLVAQYADACNLFGDPATVRRKLAVLHRHCEDVGRDPSQVRVTQLSQALVAPDEDALDAAVDARRGPGQTPEAFAQRAGAGTVEDQIGRYRDLADAGVQSAIVSLGDLDGPDAVARFAPVIGAFRR